MFNLREKLAGFREDTGSIVDKLAELRTKVGYAFSDKTTIDNSDPSNPTTTVVESPLKKAASVLAGAATNPVRGAAMAVAHTFGGSGKTEEEKAAEEAYYNQAEIRGQTEANKRMGYNSDKNGNPTTKIGEEVPRQAVEIDAEDSAPEGSPVARIGEKLYRLPRTAVEIPAEDSAPEGVPVERFGGKLYMIPETGVEIDAEDSAPEGTKVERIGNKLYMLPKNAIEIDAEDSAPEGTKVERVGEKLYMFPETVPISKENIRFYERAIPTVVVGTTEVPITDVPLDFKDKGSIKRMTVRDPREGHDNFEVTGEALDLANEIKRVADNVAPEYTDYLLRLARYEGVYNHKQRLYNFNDGTASTSDKDADKHGGIKSVDRGIFQINNAAFPEIPDSIADDPKLATLWAIALIEAGKQEKWMANKNVLESHLEMETE